MPALIFDIETIGEKFDSLDKDTQKDLTRWIEKESGSEDEYKNILEDFKNRLGFSALTGEMVVVGLLDSEKDIGGIYFQAPGKEVKTFEENGLKFEQMTEKDMLSKFWEVAARYDEFVSFNGRRFDIPFIMIRSAIHGIRPSKNLMSNRYLGSQREKAKHIDLLDQLTFYGASYKRGTLHLWSRAFGIKSPKIGGITGNEVGKFFEEGKYLDIAKYNLEDLQATRELYKRWRDYLHF